MKGDTQRIRSSLREREDDRACGSSVVRSLLHRFLGCPGGRRAARATFPARAKLQPASATSAGSVAGLHCASGLLSLI